MFIWLLIALNIKLKAKKSRTLIHRNTVNLNTTGTAKLITATDEEKVNHQFSKR